MSNNKKSSNHVPDVGKKVSSVEWLVEKLFNSGVDTTRFIKEIEKAKEMHKKETINFAQTWSSSCITKEHLEYFYNETFNNKKKT